MEYEPVIGLEIHAELETKSKMFCTCRVVDSTQAEPNSAVCPVCAGMPGTLPVVNRRAVEYGLRVALALECDINRTSIFARKNYFYPDLPKGYQISQYEMPLGRHGRLNILTSQGEKVIRVRRVHLEEDTGKLTHIRQNGQNYSLVDLNRAGVPLLEIVTEPELHTAEEVRAYAAALRSLLIYLGVNSGDMQKGVLRIEPNISVRASGSTALGTRTEIKNLNSFRALERSVAYEIQRQSELLRKGERVLQETRGWNESQELTFAQRTKEGEEDYRYFPEPDLPPLVVDQELLDQVATRLPELPAAKQHRFEEDYGLSQYDTSVLIVEPTVADFFEAVLSSAPFATPKVVANWIIGELFALLNQAGETIEMVRFNPHSFAELINMVASGEINQNTAKVVLTEMYRSGKSAKLIVDEGGLRQVSDSDKISEWVQMTIRANSEQVDSYLAGKTTVARWLFGQVMRLAQGKANPQLIQEELDRQLGRIKNESDSG